MRSKPQLCLRLTCIITDKGRNEILITPCIVFYDAFDPLDFHKEDYNIDAVSWKNRFFRILLFLKHSEK